MPFLKLRLLPLCVVASVVIMVWLGAISEDWAQAYPLKGQKNDYYNLLVDGFQAGHLYMKSEVHPDLLSPDASLRSRAPYLLDASLYHGRYYLYFGVVPAVTLFWPYAALTGHDCPQNLAVLVAVLAGFLISFRLYTEARARYFPAARGWIDCSAVGLLAFGSGSPVLLVSHGMYEVALSWGYMWIAVMTWCLFRALHTEKSLLRWLSVASLAYGLGVGSRPTIFLLGPLLPTVAILVFQRETAERSWRRLVGLAGAVAIPAGAIGLGLMAYNYARFDNPLEFGLTHQVNAISGNGQPLQSAAFIFANLRWYYLTPPTFSAFFPYLFTHSSYPSPAGYYLGSEPTHGQFLMPVLAGLCALVAVWRKAVLPGLLVWFLALLAFSFGAMLLVTSTFPYRSTRYLVDFQPQLTLLLVLLAGVASLRTARPRPLQDVWLGAYVVLNTAAWISCLLISLQFLDRFAATHPKAFQAFSYCGDYPASLLARTGWHEYGPLRFKTVFVHQPKPVFETLVATGAPGYKDVLFAAQYPNGYIDLTIYHEGHGGARTGLIPIEYGRPYEIEVDMGSLYPPVACVYFPHWAARPRETIKNFARVTIDGTMVIRTQQSFYDSSPGLLDFGRAPGRPESSFSGRLYDIQRLPLREPAALKAIAELGLWQIEFELPPPSNLGGQPLQSSGVAGRGNLLYLRNLPDGTFQFGMDFWGIGSRLSPPFARSATGTYHLEIFVGPQVARRGPRLFPDLDFHDLKTAPPRLWVWLDGQLVWTVELIANVDTYDLVSLGTNTQGFSTADPIFAGRFLPQLLLPAAARALVEKKLHLRSP